MNDPQGPDQWSRKCLRASEGRLHQRGPTQVKGRLVKGAGGLEGEAWEEELISTFDGGKYVAK